MNPQALLIPDRVTSTQSYILAKSISAIQLVPDKEGSTRLGIISELLKGTQIDVCGDGFNQRTIKVHCHGRFYFVFLQDIERAAFRTTPESLTG